MPPKKSDSHLGKALQNHRRKAQAAEYERALHTTDLPHGKNSITQESSLSNFLSTALLAATDFTATKQNTHVIEDASSTSTLPRSSDRAMRTHQSALLVPRRPKWTTTTSPAELERLERSSFLEWRRGLAELEQGEGEDQLLLTPFERNLEVWRQLWRTIERAEVVVQIVDARNPAVFRCKDLERYVDELGGKDGEAEGVEGRGKKRNLLLINKSDLLTAEQREKWLEYFDGQGVEVAFYSANMATFEEEDEDLMEGEEEDDESEDEEATDDEVAAKPEGEPAPAPAEESKASASQSNDRSRVLTAHELATLFVANCPSPSSPPSASSPPSTATSTTWKPTIGLVGYPNVGKSSTLNSLLLALAPQTSQTQRVSVSSTPGKTKHFQTHHLPDFVLCDCPGLVFPQFAKTTADLICDGVLPIDQMREARAPVDLVAKRIGRKVLGGVYGLSLGEVGELAADELLEAFAVARGYFTSGQGNPDEHRSARQILKDYVNAKLLYCHPPPGTEVDEFNAPNRDLERLKTLTKFNKKAPTTRVRKGADTFIDLERDGETVEEFKSLSARPMVKGVAANAALGKEGFSRVNHPALVGGGGGVQTGKDGKKHFKVNKRTKMRSGKGYEQTF
ncbi:P-loop containing nucleoside triphosphate hydrolase protein [Atractiella rhizophila]|nr:P-loop containing nucleoside triphosphate hydrolase protein [Atractiella rhizophila]